MSYIGRYDDDMATRKLALESADDNGAISFKSNSWAPNGVGSKSWSAICVTDPSKAKLLKLIPRLEWVLEFAAVHAKLLREEDDRDAADFAWFLVEAAALVDFGAVFLDLVEGPGTTLFTVLAAAAVKKLVMG